MLLPKHSPFHRPRAGVVGMVLWCAGTLKSGLSLNHITADLTTTVIRSYKLLINNVKAVHSILRTCQINDIYNFSGFSI